jgi:hypothetical protein
MEQLDFFAPDLFGNTFAERTLLPDGTTGVIGHLWYGEREEFDSGDYVVFDDLVPSRPFSVTYDVSSDCPTAPRILDEVGNLLVPQRDIDYEIGPWTDMGTVPASGTLVLGMSLCQDRMFYQVALDAPRVPEPSTAVLIGSGLAAGFLRRRKHR